MRILAIVIAFLLAGPALAQRASNSELARLGASATAAPAGMEILFSLQADRVLFDGKYLTLDGVAPVAPFFADRPLRIAGAVTLSQFAGIWALSETAMRLGPPVASVMVISDGRDPAPIVELHSISIGDRLITFEAKVLSGELPDASGPVALMFRPRVWWPRSPGQGPGAPAPAGTPDISCFMTFVMGQSMCRGVLAPDGGTGMARPPAR